MKNCIVPTVAGWRCCVQQSMFMVSVIKLDNYLYVCSGYPSCDSYIVHKKSMRPMGTLANGDLRHKRIEAHRALNKVVQAGIMTKHGAYIWLQNRLCLREKDMHIGMFSEYRCEETIRECNILMEQYAKTNRISSCEKKTRQHEKWKGRHPAFAGG